MAKMKQLADWGRLFHEQKDEVGLKQRMQLSNIAENESRMQKKGQQWPKMKQPVIWG